jgi:hypothetical protein
LPWIAETEPGWTGRKRGTQIARIDDHTEKAKALEAAGLSE